MRVLITGSQGLVGKMLTPGIVPHHAVVGFDIALKPELDILNMDALRRYMFGCEAVVHLAAIPHPFRSEDYDLINRIGGERVIEAAEYEDVQHFVYMSSSDVYGICGGPSLEEPLPDGPLTEDEVNMEHLLACEYARSKFQVARALQKSSIPNWVIFRLENPGTSVEPGNRVGAVCPPELLQKAVLAALTYEGKLVANLMADHPLFDTTRLKELIGE